MTSALTFRNTTRIVKGSTQGQPWEEKHHVTEVTVRVQDGRGPATVITMEFDAGDFSRALAKPGFSIVPLSVTMDTGKRSA